MYGWNQDHIYREVHLLSSCFFSSFLIAGVMVRKRFRISAKHIQWSEDLILGVAWYELRMQIVFIWWDRFRDSNTGAGHFFFHFLLICNAASWAWFVDGLRCVGDILGAIRVMVFILNRTGMFAREGLRRQRNGVLPARISLSSSSFFPYFWVKPNAKRETYFRKCSAERLGSIWLRHRRMRMKNVQAVNGRRAVFFFFCVCVW